MDKVPNTSFIPKQGGNVGAAPVHRRRRFNVVGFIAVVLFVSSVLLGVGAFAYQILTERQLDSAKQQLAEQRTLFQTSEAARIKDINQRLSTANKLLSAHPSPSRLFDVLEATTQQKIQFTNLTLSRRNSGNVTLSLEGVAPSFNTVALQARRFSEESLFTWVLFSELDKNTEGSVTFKVTAEIDADAIAYRGAPIIESMPEESVTAESTATSTIDNASDTDTQDAPEEQDNNDPL